MNLFSYDGRMERLPFLGYYILFVIITIVLSFIPAIVPFQNFILWVFSSVATSFLIVKRFHDMDRPGWHFWLLLIPIYNIALIITLIFVSGTQGQNKYDLVKSESSIVSSTDISSPTPSV